MTPLAVKKLFPNQREQRQQLSQGPVNLAEVALHPRVVSSLSLASTSQIATHVSTRWPPPAPWIQVATGETETAMTPTQERMRMKLMTPHMRPLLPPPSDQADRDRDRPEAGPNRSPPLLPGRAVVEGSARPCPMLTPTARRTARRRRR
jgi:hypothetical protein